MQYHQQHTLHQKINISGFGLNCSVRKMCCQKQNQANQPETMKQALKDE
jgi:hypothetical protein